MGRDGGVCRSNIFKMCGVSNSLDVKCFLIIFTDWRHWNRDILSRLGAQTQSHTLMVWCPYITQVYVWGGGRRVRQANLPPSDLRPIVLHLQVSTLPWLCATFWFEGAFKESSLHCKLALLLGPLWSGSQFQWRELICWLPSLLQVHTKCFISFNPHKAFICDEADTIEWILGKWFDLTRIWNLVHGGSKPNPTEWVNR